MMKRLQQAGLAILTLIVITLGAVVWDTRPIAAEEPPMDPSARAWCQRVHAELFSALPKAVQEHLIAMHNAN